MKSKKLLAIGSALLLVAGFVSLGAMPANAGNENNQNETTYWQNQYPGTTCYKDNGAYGSVTGGANNFVTLTGNHDWVALIVNSGAVDTGNGPGNAVYSNPVSGTAYATPLNGGGNQGAVSHWIVCVGAPVTPQDASASASPTDATCQAPGGVNFSVTNATWENDTDVTDGSRTAIANAGHLFPGGASTLVVTYAIAPQLTGEQCATIPQDASASANPTDATCQAPGGVNFSVTNATWENDTDVTDGSRTAIANAGHLFPGGASTLVVTYAIAPQLTGEQCLTVVSTVPEVTFTDVCGIANDAIVGGTDTASIDYTITDGRVDGVGLVTVTAVPQSGYTFADSAYTGPWTHTFTNVACAVDYVVMGDPYAVDLTCTETGFTDGYIWVDFGGDLADELDYRIEGPGGVNFLATQETNVLDPGDYTVTAIAKPGHTLDPSAQSVWPLTIGVSGDCQLISHPPVTPTASMSNLTCSSGGSYTLVDTEGVKWLVNGSEKPAGTYPVTSASTVNVEAQLTSTVDYTWEDGAQTQWPFNFTSPKDCLPTLAFTGSDGAGLGLLLAGGFLLVGGAVVAVEKRLRREAR